MEAINYLEKYLADKETITMIEIVKECFQLKEEDNNGTRVSIGRLIKKLGWNKYQESDGSGKRYYRKGENKVRINLLKNIK